MADRFARPVLVGFATLALLDVATPAAARTHHVAPKHATTRHHSEAMHGSETKHSGPNTKKPKENRGVGPGGVTNVPDGGLKVFCPHHSPLLIRKATQGAGTTVTVVCR